MKTNDLQRFSKMLMKRMELEETRFFGARHFWLVTLS